MTEIRDIVAYFCQHYPHKRELSKARVTKMVYLADWKSAIDYGRQLTNINWVFNHYGPYVEDVVNVAQSDPAFAITPQRNAYGNFKEVISLQAVYVPVLTKEERDVLEHVINTTAQKYWNDFIELVYSTYPIMTQERHAQLNLVALAKEYKSTQTAVAV